MCGIEVGIVVGIIDVVMCIVCVDGDKELW